MGAKDLYLFQIVQYSSSDSEKKPSQWKFFVHYCDKAGNPTGDGETHGMEVTPNSPKYAQHRSQFITPRFRGACTLGLFYKKNLYRILEELEASKVGVVRKASSKRLAHSQTGAAIGAEAELASLPRVWVEDRLEALRRAGVVLLGPSLDEMMRRAYQSWVTHGEHMQQTGLRTNTPAITSLNGSQGEIIDLRWGGTGSADLIKRYYCYPYVHYASS